LLKLISQAALALPDQVYDPIISAVLVSESGVGLQNEGIHKMAQLYFRVWKRVPLLARGRDRLETALNRSEMGHIIPYSTQTGGKSAQTYIQQVFFENQHLLGKLL
jgi:hypothetical protein